MSRKDYIAIANAFAKASDLNNVSLTHTLYELASDIATQMKRDNPNFDRARFMSACKLED